MNELYAIAQRHPTGAIFTAFFLFSCIVGGMPDRTKYISAKLYLFDWVYNTLHLMTATVTKELHARYPNVVIDTKVAGDQIISTPEK